MAKTPTTAPPEDQQAGLAAAPPADAAATTEPETPPEGGEAVPPVGETSAYDQAVAFQPDPWDQLPEDPEVREFYITINGHLPSFLRRNR